MRFNKRQVSAIVERATEEQRVVALGNYFIGVLFGGLFGAAISYVTLDWYGFIIR